jgi:poly(A) polymerase
MTTPDHRPSPAAARGLVERLQQAGFEAYWVGGCVRDRLMGREPKDYDIATSARPEQVEALFPRTIPVGRAFGVVLILHEGVQYEIATFRAEADYADGRHPAEVRFATAQADARRRDFTINGCFYDPVSDRLHDWVGGRADLERRLIRTIGAPAERFGEDHLRLLRAVRFAAQLGFEIEASTFSAIQTLAALVLRVSAERIRDELLKLFQPAHAARGLDLLEATGLLLQILPEIAAFRACHQPPQYHPEGDVYQHVRLMLTQLPADAPPLLPWAVLLHDVAKPATATPDPVTGQTRFYGHERAGAELTGQILHRLRFPRAQIDELKAAVLHHMQFKDVRRMRKATLRRMLLRPTFPLELELHRLDCLGSHGQLDHYDLLVRERAEFAAKPQLLPPLLNGDDLMAMGVPEGPRVGRLLIELRDRQLAEEIRTREEALAWARERAASLQAEQ